LKGVRKVIKSYLFQYWPFWVAMIPTICLVVLIVKRGVTLTNDSHMFLCAANSWAETGQLNMCDGSPFVLSAIGFPVLLSLFEDPIRVFFFLLPILVYGHLVSWLYFFKKAFVDKTALILASIALICGLPMFFPFLFLWSEGGCLFVLAAGTLSMQKAIESNHPKWWWIVGLCYGMAVFFRFAALFLVIPLCVGYVTTRKIYAKQIGCILLVCAVLCLLMLFRVWYLTGAFDGNRTSMQHGVFEVLVGAFQSIVCWLAPVSCIWHVSVLLLGMLMFVTLAIYSRWPVNMVVCSYFILVVYTASRTEIEYDERLFVPIYPFFVLCSVDVFAKAKTKKWGNYWAFGGAFLWVTYMIARFCKNMALWAS
jgi:hypothetical protein